MTINKLQLRCTTIFDAGQTKSTQSLIDLVKIEQIAITQARSTIIENENFRCMQLALEDSQKLKHIAS